MNISQKNFVITPNISDHYPISSIFSNRVSEKPTIMKFRDYSAQNCEKFFECIENEFGNCSPPVHDVNLFTAYFLTFLNSILNRYFPVKTKTITQKRIRDP